jgi:hypothetical protein
MYVLCPWSFFLRFVFWPSFIPSCGFGFMRTRAPIKRFLLSICEFFVMAESSSASEKIRQIYFAIGIATTQWQGVEHALTQLFVILSGDGHGVASAAFNSVLGFRNKLDMVRAAAAARLNNTDLMEECLRLCKRLQKKSQKRNDIVHFMLYQVAVAYEAGEPINAASFDQRVDWYLSPMAFDSARHWRYKGKVPELKTIDIMNRANAFIKAGNDVWTFSEKVRAFLTRPQASRES